MKASVHVFLALAAVSFGWPVQGQNKDITGPTISALEFNGFNSYVDIRPAAAVFGDFTISGWFKIRDKGSRQFLYRISNQEPLTRCIELSESDGTIIADIRPKASGDVYSISSTNFSYAKWTHIAFVRERDQLRLYFDGRLVGSQTATTNAIVANRWAFLGANTYNNGTFGSASGFFLGIIDDFQIWTVARTAQEIADASAVPESAPGLLAYWRFNERHGTRTVDSSIHRFDGTVIHTHWTLPLFAISGVEPQEGSTFANAENGISFTVYTGINGVARTNIILRVNGQDVSSQIGISGTDYEKYVEFNNLAQDQFYRAEISVTDRKGATLTKVVSFGTFRPAAYRRYAVWAGAVVGGVCLIIACAWSLAGHYFRRRALKTLRFNLARDIHDEIGSNLSGIAVLSEVALESGATADHQQKDWSEVNQIARETLGSIREVLLFVVEHEEINFDLMKHMRLAADRILAGKDMHWESSVDHLPPDWRAEDQREIFLFFKETVINIVRHARATRVKILTLISDDCFQLQIIDNGCGFTPGRVKLGIGLRSLRMRARAMKGKMKITSEPGNGTKVELRVGFRKNKRRWRDRAKIREILPPN
jgi:signal transduction histidine kinase